MTESVVVTYRNILTKDSTEPTLIKSAFNFIYGCALIIYLGEMKVFKPQKSIKDLSAIEKLKALLESLEQQHPEFFLIDSPTYKLDDKTKEFINEDGVKIFKKLRQDLKGLSSQEFLLKLEEFFQQSF